MRSLNNRNNKPLIVLLLFLFVYFIIIPLFVSTVFGNPFDRFNLDTYDVLVSNKRDLSNTEMSFFYNNAYTWDEVSYYVFRNELTFFRVFQINAIIIGIAIVAIIIDRKFIRGMGSNSRRRK